MGCAGNRLSQGKISAYSSKEKSGCAMGLIISIQFSYKNTLAAISNEKMNYKITYNTGQMK